MELSTILLLLTHVLVAWAPCALSFRLENKANLERPQAQGKRWSDAVTLGGNSTLAHADGSRSSASSSSVQPRLHPSREHERLKATGGSKTADTIPAVPVSGPKSMVGKSWSVVVQGDKEQDVHGNGSALSASSRVLQRGILPTPERKVSNAAHESSPAESMPDELGVAQAPRTGLRAASVATFAAKLGKSWREAVMQGTKVEMARSDESALSVSADIQPGAHPSPEREASRATDESSPADLLPDAVSADAGLSHGSTTDPQVASAAAPAANAGEGEGETVTQGEKNELANGDGSALSAWSAGLQPSPERVVLAGTAGSSPADPTPSQLGSSNPSLEEPNAASYSVPPAIVRKSWSEAVMRDTSNHSAHKPPAALSDVVDKNWSQAAERRKKKQPARTSGTALSASSEALPLGRPSTELEVWPKISDTITGPKPADKRPSIAQSGGASDAFSAAVPLPGESLNDAVVTLESKLEVPEASVRLKPADRMRDTVLLSHPQTTGPEGITTVPHAAEDAARVADPLEMSKAFHAALRNQVEYYLCDENLRHDKFFHDKISLDPDGWLDIELILGCNRMRCLKATREDVLAALEESELEVKDGGAFIRRPGNAMLPKLEPKPEHRSVYMHDCVDIFWDASMCTQPALPSFTGTQQFLNAVALRGGFKQRLGSESGGKHATPDGSNQTFIEVAHDDDDLAEVLKSVRSVLHSQVELALASQGGEHMVTGSAPKEAAKRIVRYIYNAAKQKELRSLPFEKACDQLVQFAMTNYEKYFGEKEWFFELDLAPAFAAAAWELLSGTQGLVSEQVQAKTREAFKEYLDAAMLNKGIWKASGDTFEDAAVHNKVYEAVRKAHRRAFEETITEVGPGEELDRIELVQGFFKRWMNDSVSRAMNSVPDAEWVLTIGTVSRLFQNMLAPFGTNVPFSTIPKVFTKRIGPPPREWPFVLSEAKAVFNAWNPKVSRGHLVKRSPNIHSTHDSSRKQPPTMWPDLEARMADETDVHG